MNGVVLKLFAPFILFIFNASFNLILNTVPPILDLEALVYIEGAMSRCTDADNFLCCSATVGNLGERGEPDILT